MGVSVSLDAFQEKMVNLMEGLEFVRTYLNDLLLICNATFEEYLSKLTTVLRRLRRTELKSIKEDPSSTGSVTTYYSQTFEMFIRHGTLLQRYVEA